ncbi:hypothetical protein J2858_000443 [Neorhizobium galegae]|uniref:peptidoglycan-binding domain-containing protein n=1 Tax=Neorhizobium galegae TaxID=399 RepID=UPI001AE40EB5|nr:peptidoglycan-binding domain-containing protein [Neorhizobium galegae]MBP2547550.1 hypothetical protein [Neorhizobium galegae]
MTARKRKPAERRRAPAKRPGLVLRALSGVAGLGARYPRTLGGSTALFVIFSFIAANALWYQPRNHPHPFLATRDPLDPNAIAGYRPQRRAAPETVTTFRIERAADLPTDEVAGAPASPSTDPSGTGARGTSGHAAPMTPQTVISDDTPAAGASVVPLPRPAVANAAPAGAVAPAAKSAGAHAPADADPVAAAIRAAGNLPVPVARTGSGATPSPAGQSQRPSSPKAALAQSVGVPPADIPAASRASKARESADLKAMPVSMGSQAELVLQIQQGLSNIAYSDVSIDGVAGEQTRAAIRHFQKHYRLPVDGEPSEAVLAKLKSIGAL